SHVIGHHAQDPMIGAEANAPRAQQQTEKKEKSDGREIAQHIFLIDAPPESRQKEKGKLDRRTKWIQARALITIACRNRHISHACVVKVERDQHVVFKKVAAVDRAKIQQAKRIG